ncbi:MAG: dihydroorotase family protein [Candidatus Jordarchaeaceae archaeon]
MVADLVLTNTKIYYEKKLVKAGLAIEKGKILKIAKEPNLPKASKKIDLKGKILLPGIIDVHTHLRDQEKAYKEDFQSGTKAAAAGGITIVLDMPNNQPVTMDAETLRQRKTLAKPNIYVNVGFYSAFPHNLEEIEKIAREGAVGFKLFLIQQIGGLNINNNEALTAAFKKVKEIDMPIAVHAEDQETVEEAKRKLHSKGLNDVRAFLEAYSPNAEVKALKRVIDLTIKTRVHTHICHITTANGLEIIATTKRLNLPITCEVTPHHLLLTEEKLKNDGKIALTDPPLRSKTDIEALWEGIGKGIVDVIASDHAPHLLEEKNAELIWQAKVGVPGLETTLPLMLTQLSKGRITLPKLVELLAENPAKIFHIKDRGTLAVGNYADLVVVDLKQKDKIDASKFYSKAKFSPFNGWKIEGKPVKTFVNGSLVMDEGEIVAKAGTGKILD